ncbi:hypothetical protein KIW84_030848 [Lathyrus oleraceus]|uniref:Gag-pol polyprotein n=1 Tax=Pisum sativum TaxID=3888 RepID=A0A9D4XU98_PEA|nr:hypothetical protein KIW84_030848 [Pisum sativum]
MKVTAIEESQDISNMRVDEIIGSIQTFEMGMCDGSEKKVKSIAFMSNTEEEEKESGQDIDEDLANDVAMLGRQFNRLLKKMDVRSKANVKNIASNISKSNNARRRTRSDEKPKEGKGVQCHECDGVNRLTPWVNRLTQDKTRFLAKLNSVNRLTPWVNRLTQTEQQFLRNHNSVNRLMPWVNRLTQKAVPALTRSRMQNSPHFPPLEDFRTSDSDSVKSYTFGKLQLTQLQIQLQL